MATSFRTASGRWERPAQPEQGQHDRRIRPPGPQDCFSVGRRRKERWPRCGPEHEPTDRDSQRGREHERLPDRPHRGQHAGALPLRRPLATRGGGTDAISVSQGNILISASAPGATGKAAPRPHIQRSTGSLSIPRLTWRVSMSSSPMRPMRVSRTPAPPRAASGSRSPIPTPARSSRRLLRASREISCSTARETSSRSSFTTPARQTSRCRC